MSVLGRLTGIGAAASVTLGLLAGGCVLAATAGPRQTQATGTRALQQTLGSVSPLDKSVVATTDWSVVNTSFGGLSGGGGGGVELSPANLATVTSQLRSDFSGGPLTLDPQSADWAALTSEPYNIAALPVLKGIPAKLEVAYRYPLAGHVRLVAGTMPTALSPAAQAGLAIQVVITQAMASTFKLEPGSSVSIGVPSDAQSGRDRRDRPRRDRDRRAHRPRFPVLDRPIRCCQGRPCPTPPEVRSGLARSSPIPASSGRYSRSSARPGSSCSGSSR